jgi:hypothetical protein
MSTVARLKRPVLFLLLVPEVSVHLAREVMLQPPKKLAIGKEVVGRPTMGRFLKQLVFSNIPTGVLIVKDVVPTNTPLAQENEEHAGRQLTIDRRSGSPSYPR